VCRKGFSWIGDFTLCQPLPQSRLAGDGAGEPWRKRSWPLGQFLASPDKDAFLAVNSKGVDCALMDETVLK
jgi:hypothetical protein